MEKSRSLAVISKVRVFGVKKRRQPKKHYVYIIRVQRSDGKNFFVLRRLKQFYELQSSLSDLIANKSISLNLNESELPILPEKIVFGRSHIRNVAEERRLQIDSYCQKLIGLPSSISQSDAVLSFFSATDDDIHFWTVPEKDLERQLTNVAREVSVPLEMEKYSSKHDYKARSKDELSLSFGSVVMLIEKTDIGWWYVQMESRSGWVPAAFLQPVEVDTVAATSVTRPPTAAEFYIVKKSYIPSSSSSSSSKQCSDELALVPGMIFNILTKNLDGWWLAHGVDGSVGMVPGCCLSPVDASKAQDLTQLLPEICTQSAAAACHSDGSSRRLNGGCELNVILATAHFTKAD